MTTNTTTNAGNVTAGVPFLGGNYKFEKLEGMDYVRKVTKLMEEEKRKEGERLLVAPKRVDATTGEEVDLGRKRLRVM